MATTPNYGINLLNHGSTMPVVAAVIVDPETGLPDTGGNEGNGGDIGGEITESVGAPTDPMLEDPFGDGSLISIAKAILKNAQNIVSPQRPKITEVVSVSLGANGQGRLPALNIHGGVPVTAISIAGLVSGDVTDIMITSEIGGTISNVSLGALSAKVLDGTYAGLNCPLAQSAIAITLVGAPNTTVKVAVHLYTI